MPGGFAVRAGGGGEGDDDEEQFGDVFHTVWNWRGCVLGVSIATVVILSAVVKLAVVVVAMVVVSAIRAEAPNLMVAAVIIPALMGVIVTPVISRKRSVNARSLYDYLPAMVVRPFFDVAAGQQSDGGE